MASFNIIDRSTNAVIGTADTLGSAKRVVRRENRDLVENCGKPATIGYRAA